MVGLVVVSHSQGLAEGVVELARQMASDELRLEAAGGTSEPGVLGTDAARVMDAVAAVMSADGVLVLMDLGSALMSAEFAVEMLGGTEGPVKLTAAPLVEGTVAAAVSASGGASLEQVAAEARGALAMKAAQITEDSAGAAAEDSPVPADVDARAELAVRNEIGLHARPAARFVETVQRFDASVFVSKAGASVSPVEASSLTNLVALGARRGDTLVVTASGSDAQAVVDALVELAGGGFGDGVSSAGGSAPVGKLPAARGVRPTAPPPVPADGTVLRGIAASEGVAVGAAFLLGDAGRPPDKREAADADTELKLLEHGRELARAAITRDREALRGRAGASEAAIFEAHLALLDDDALLAPARDAINVGATAERAWHDAAAQVAEVYRGLADRLLQERATDVLDVGRRVVAALSGGDEAPSSSPAGIVIADELTPADTAGLDPERVTGIATAHGSTTAHAAIIARSLGLPAVVGIGAELLAIEAGTELLLDGEAGTVVVAPSADEIAAATERRERERERAEAALSRASEPATLRSGETIEVFANIGSARDAEKAVACGAEGVGLLRTEFLFLDRPELPDEDEQVSTLLEIARVLDGRTLVMRTLDAGADKPLPALPMPPEQNPFLGVRGIRLQLARPELLATQLRAALRVAAEHPVKVMLPMVATLDEVLQSRATLDEARAALGVDTPLELGIMVEVPAAALAAERIAPHVDFFSVGTNDLTQYTMAAERGDARLANLLASPQPAVLRLIQATVEGAVAGGAWVGVCGEMAGDPACAVLLSGLGVTELSMSPRLIPAAKAALRAVSLSEATAAAAAALRVDSAEQARALALTLL
jgi:phosphocarrier protein FPr